MPAGRNNLLFSIYATGSRPRLRLPFELAAGMALAVFFYLCWITL